MVYNELGDPFMKTGMANLPLHGHHCPRWLFDRMVRLSTAIVEVIVEEYGPEEILKRMSDPFWFQSLGCVVGFDWHSSGLTTVLCGALKEGLRPRQQHLGLYMAGGKALASKKTPLEIEEYTEKFGLGVDVDGLRYASRMAAKVDNSALQDGFQIYHHVFFFTGGGKWAVVQQGMNQGNGWARRYHWLGEGVKDFIEEPHSGISGSPAGDILNMVSSQSRNSRNASVYLAREKPVEVTKTLKKLSLMSHQEISTLSLPSSHPVPNASRIEKALSRLYNIQPGSYRELLSTEGVGPSTIRAFALVAEVIYGVKPCRRDPVRYSFAHGGKDGHPFPVNRKDYDRSIELLERALRRVKSGHMEVVGALKRLSGIQKHIEKNNGNSGIIRQPL